MLFSCLQVAGGPLSWMALALAGSMSIPFQLTMNPKNFLEETHKSAFQGVHLQVVPSVTKNTTLRSST